MVRQLTPRQQEIIFLKSLGLTNKEVAARLGIAASTVGLHVGAIIRRTESHNITEAVAKWTKRKSGADTV